MAKVSYWVKASYWAKATGWLIIEYWLFMEGLVDRVNENMDLHSHERMVSSSCTLANLGVGTPDFNHGTIHSKVSSCQVVCVRFFQLCSFHIHLYKVQYAAVLSDPTNRDSGFFRTGEAY